MRIVRVFIASSEEFRIKGLEFNDPIQQPNRILQLSNVEMVPVEGEYLDTPEDFMYERKEYGRQQACKMCLARYGFRFCNYTIGEQDAVNSELRIGDNQQKLYTCFKDTDDISYELKAFKASFSAAYGYFSCRLGMADSRRFIFLFQHVDPESTISEEMLKVREAEVSSQPPEELKTIFSLAGKNSESLHGLKQYKLNSGVSRRSRVSARII